jgi:hypothetical protein
VVLLFGGVVVDGGVVDGVLPLGGVALLSGDMVVPGEGFVLDGGVAVLSAGGVAVPVPLVPLVPDVPEVLAGVVAVVSAGVVVVSFFLHAPSRPAISAAASRMRGVKVGVLIENSSFCRCR